MKICDVTQFYSPYGGGVKRYLTEKRRYVVSRTEDEHHLIIPGARTEHIVEGRLHTHTIKSPPISYTSRYRALLNQDALRAVLREIQPDVIESGDPYQVAWTALEEAHRQRVPIVGFYHSHFPEAYLRTAARFGGPLVRDAVLNWSQGYVRKLYNRFNYTLVCAERLRGVLRGWGVDNVRPIKLGVDTQAFQPGPRETELRRRLGVPTTSFLLLFVGRLAGEKNIATLLDAFRRLRRQSRIDFQLLVIGQGPWREQLLDTREETGGALHWIPHVSQSGELAKIYRSADLCVHPSINETFGLVPLEAQACGLPICGIRGSCLDENIMAGLEHWAPENSGPALAAAIERMCRLDLREMGQEAAEAVKTTYAWPVVLDELWDCYQELTLRARARRQRGIVHTRLEEREIVVRKFHAADREAVRRICCDTGFLGRPIDPIFEDREIFADFLTAYYTDAEPESVFVLEIDGEVAGYLCGCRAHARRRWFHLRKGAGWLLRAAGRYLLRRYSAPSRRYLRWLVGKGSFETPPRPAHTPHFHVNILPGSRSIPATKALIDAFLAYLQAHGEKAVYGQMVVYEERRGEGLFTRFGFQVLNRREITKYRSHFNGRVFLCTAWKELAADSRLDGARTRFWKERRA